MSNKTEKRNGKAVKPTVVAYKYYSVHGHLPRGRGFWAFHPEFDVDSGSAEIFRTGGSFAEAKRKAVAHFTGKAAFVEVLS